MKYIRMKALVAVGLLLSGVACTESGGNQNNGGRDGIAGTGGAGGTAGSQAGAGGSAGTGGVAGTMSAGAGGGGGIGGAQGGSGGAAGTGGQGGAPSDAGTAGTGGASGAGGATGGAGGATGGSGGAGGLEGNFSFFVTSIEAMRELSGSPDGFGGDLGGLEGADAICQQIAEGEGAGHKTWRAFLSATTGGPNGGPVHAIDRIGEGPWYDRNGRLVAMDKAGLISGDRPAGDAEIVDNLPNERGEPLNQNGTDDHDVITGSNSQGQLNSDDPNTTCQDWTSTETADTGGGGSSFGGFGGFGGGGFGGNGPMLGHSWPARSGANWIQAHGAAGCAAGVVLEQNGPPAPGSECVGCGGGYGAIYCFALSP